MAREGDGGGGDAQGEIGEQPGGETPLAWLHPWVAVWVSGWCRRLWVCVPKTCSEAVFLAGWLVRS